MSKLYARSDLSGVAVPESAGGCGQWHGRPVENGAPADEFELDCDRCTTALRDDPHWSTRSDDLPKTPDEQAKLDEEAKRGMISNKDDLVSGIAKGISEGLANLTTCRNCGKMSPSGMKFCGECGNQLGAPPAKRDDGDDRSDGDADVVDGESKTHDQAELKQRLDEQDGDDEDLSKKRVHELRELAKERGVDESGTKRELLERLQGEGK